MIANVRFLPSSIEIDTPKANYSRFCDMLLSWFRPIDIASLCLCTPTTGSQFRLCVKEKLDSDGVSLQLEVYHFRFLFVIEKFTGACGKGGF